MITIRKAIRNDAQTIAQFNAAMADETEHLLLDMNRLFLGVSGMFDDESRGFYLVAEINDAIIGQLMITYEWSDWRNGVFWWIQSVYVKKEFRGQKVFGALYRYVHSMAKEQADVCGLRLYVEKENELAHSIYTTLGMMKTEYDLLEVDFVIKR